MQLNNTDTTLVKFNDEGIEKQFVVVKLKSTRFFKFTNQLLAMLARTETLKNPEIIKQYIYTKLQTGLTLTNPDTGQPFDKAQVHNAVEKEKVDNPGELVFDLLKSILMDIDFHQENILTGILSCVYYQNGTDLINLNAIENDGHCVDLFIKDGINLYKLCWEVLKFNYQKVLGSEKK